MSIDWKLPTSASGIRADTADKPDRAALEAEAAKRGVPIKPGMSDRQIREAVAEKLMPGVYAFTGKADTYAEVAFGYAVAAAEKEDAANAQRAIWEADIARASPLAAATPGGHVSGATHPAVRADAVRSSVELRQRMDAVAAAERQGTAPRVQVVHSTAELRTFNRQNRR